MSQPEPAYNLPMSVEYAQDLIKHKAFPYIDSHSQVFLHATAGGSSIGWKDNWQYSQRRELSEHIKHHFPNDHIHTVTLPYQHVIKFKPDMLQRKVTGSRLEWRR
jgi:hypothetical protein